MPTMTLVPKDQMRSRFDRSLTTRATGATTLTVRDQKIGQMLALAAETGFVCEPVTKFRQEFLKAVTNHLVHREGMNVYQSPPSTSRCFRERRR